MGGLYVCFTINNINYTTWSDNIKHISAVDSRPSSTCACQIGLCWQGTGGGFNAWNSVELAHIFHSFSNIIFGVWRIQWEEPLGFDHPKLCELRWKHVSTWRHESQILRRHPAQHETQAFLYETGHLSDLKASWVKYHMSRIPTRDNPS
jgi:hypothetical protein